MGILNSVLSKSTRIKTMIKHESVRTDNNFLEYIEAELERIINSIRLQSMKHIKVPGAKKK